MNELIDAICDYIRKPYTDYAIMLNGKWGSGKTYFWNNKLRSRLESIKVDGKSTLTRREANIKPVNAIAVRYMQ